MLWYSPTLACAIAPSWNFLPCRFHLAKSVPSFNSEKTSWRPTEDFVLFVPLLGHNAGVCRIITVTVTKKSWESWSQGDLGSILPLMCSHEWVTKTPWASLSSLVSGESNSTTSKCCLKESVRPICKVLCSVPGTQVALSNSKWMNEWMNEWSYFPFD